MLRYNLMTALVLRRLLFAVAIIPGLASPVLALPGTVNLAPAGIATGTATEYGASLTDGNDGNRDGNFGNGSVYYTINGDGVNPLFYEVDLGVDAFVERVQLLRRSDADQGVFGNMRLTVFEDDGAGNPGAISFQHDYLPSFQKGTFGTTDPGADGAFGRHVRIERIDPNYWLTFAEFEIIGSTSPLRFTENDNIAAGKPVTTSSPAGYGALMSSANDGDINADFHAPNRPVYHSTNYSVGEYWQVDFGKEFKLDYLELFARSDDHTTSEYLVSVLDENFTVVGSTLVNNPAFNATNPGYDHTIDVSGLVGRYVRVETTQNQFLAFTELRAFAVPEPASLLILTIGVFSLLSQRHRAQT
jgi:hypothetical protein